MVLHVEQFALQGKQVTGDVPLVKYPLPHAPQVWFVPERMPVEQEVQFVDVPTQVAHGAVHMQLDPERIEVEGQDRQLFAPFP